MICQNCDQEKIIRVCAKCSDMFWCEYPNGDQLDGYVPHDFNLGQDPDYIEFNFCSHCGTIQGIKEGMATISRKNYDDLVQKSEVLDSLFSDENYD